MHQLGLRLTSAATRTVVPQFKSHRGSRWLHQRQPLPYPVEGGLGKFLPPEALQVQLEYQDGLLQRLNDEVAGTSDAGASIAQTVINLSGKQNKILAFNYASLALNNSFFLNNLKPPSDKSPTYEHEISLNLGSSIRLGHGSVQQLRSAFSAAVLGTFMNGWIWFVTDQTGNTAIVPTYGPGTLLVRSRSNMEHSSSQSMATTFSPPRSPIAQPPPPGTSPTSPVSGSSSDNSLPTSNPLHPRFYHTGVSHHITSPPIGIYSSQGGQKQRVKPVEALNAGEVLYPLFCIPVYEHAWMSAGYGVWGREQWLKEFWSVLNWKKIDAAYMAVYDAIPRKQTNPN